MTYASTPVSFSTTYIIPFNLFCAETLSERKASTAYNPRRLKLVVNSNIASSYQLNLNSTCSPPALTIHSGRRTRLTLFQPFQCNRFWISSETLCSRPPVVKYYRSINLVVSNGRKICILWSFLLSRDSNGFEIIECLGFEPGIEIVALTFTWFRARYVWLGNWS